MSGEKNNLSHDIFPMIFEGHLRKALWFLYEAALIKITLGISENIPIEGLSSQKINTKRTVSPYLYSLKFESFTSFVKAFHISHVKLFNN